MNSSPVLESRFHPNRAIGFALASTLLYGVVPAATGLAFQNGISPIEVTFFRTLLVCLGMLAIALIAGQKIALPRGRMKAFWLQALATLVISVGFLGSVAFIPVSLTILIFYTFPILTLASAPFVEGKRLNFREMLAVGLAFIGLGIAVGPSFSVLDWRGIALAGAASCGVVAQFHCARALGGAMAPAVQGFLIHLVILPITLGLALWIGRGHLPFLSQSLGLGQMGLLLVGVCYLLAFFLHMSALVLAPASTIVPYYNLEPLISMIMAAILVGEYLNPVQYIGVLLVFSGLIIAALPGRRA